MEVLVHILLQSQKSQHQILEQQNLLHQVQVQVLTLQQKIQQVMSGLIEETYTISLIDYNNTKCSIEHFFYQKNRDYFPVSNIAFAILSCFSVGGSTPSKGYSKPSSFHLYAPNV